MSRYFISVSAIDVNAKSILITGDDVNHIKNVLRAVSGDKLIVSDGCGNEYSASIEAISKDSISCNILEAYKNRTEPPIDVTLFQGIPKSDKMDMIIQKSVELGVNRIVPVITERTIMRFDGSKDMEAKTKRWQRISLEAAKQCNRGIIPKVEPPVKFGKAVETLKEYELSLIPYELERDKGIGEHIKNKINGRICFFIGPEGGFTENEVQIAANKGAKPVSLGPRILRTETAGAAVMAILMYELGDMGK